MRPYRYNKLFKTDSYCATQSVTLNCAQLTKPVRKNWFVDLSILFLQETIKSLGVFIVDNTTLDT